jgi:hypothetical protein
MAKEKAILTANEEKRLANEVTMQCIRACTRCCKEVQVLAKGYMGCALKVVAPEDAPEACGIVTLQNAMRDLQTGKASPSGLKASAVKIAAVQTLERGAAPLEAAVTVAAIKVEPDAG